jgi:hypothetical protein
MAMYWVSRPCAQTANEVAFSLGYALELEEKLRTRECEAEALRSELHRAKGELAQSKVAAVRTELHMRRSSSPRRRRSSWGQAAELLELVGRPPPRARPTVAGGEGKGLVVRRERASGDGRAAGVGQQRRASMIPVTGDQRPAGVDLLVQRVAGAGQQRWASTIPTTGDRQEVHGEGGSRHQGNFTGGWSRASCSHYPARSSRSARFAALDTALGQTLEIFWRAR